MVLEYSEVEEARLETLRDGVTEISQFRRERMGLTEGSFSGEEKIPITFHDPCHLKKSLGVAAEPRASIRANTRDELK